MIDFTNLPRKNKTYAGANGNKIAIVYEGEQYRGSWNYAEEKYD